MPLYEEKLICPLAVRFSQDRIWPDFQDGRPCIESCAEIEPVPVTNIGNYRTVLMPPFPPMEIIRLRQELREDDGERVRDEKGRRSWGEESWFTFDNRRLYCLQRTALQYWPTPCAVVVKVLFDFPAVRCARHKFRTTTDGCAVKISLPDGRPGLTWNWMEAIQERKTEPMQFIAGLGVVKDDAAKNNKDVLTEVPPMRLLKPGARETTVAERFNLGTSRGNESGKSAGMQLLSFVCGGGEPPGPEPGPPPVMNGGGETYDYQANDGKGWGFGPGPPYNDGGKGWSQGSWDQAAYPRSGKGGGGGKGQKGDGQKGKGGKHDQSSYRNGAKGGKSGGKAKRKGKGEGE